MKQLTNEINYSKSITKLYNDIKEILIEKIKEENSDYNYVTISDLRKNAILYLSSEMQSYAIALHNLVMQPRDEVYEYNMLLNIYEDLK